MRGQSSANNFYQSNYPNPQMLDRFMRDAALLELIFIAYPSCKCDLNSSKLKLLIYSSPDSKPRWIFTFNRLVNR